MKKILVSVLLIILLILIGGGLYLLRRPCDYQAHFTVKTTPDIVYFNILNENIWNRKQVNSKIEITGKTPVSHISKKILLNDTTLLFNWEFRQLNDSITTVRVCVSDPDRKLFNRLTAPIINTTFKKSVRGNLLDIMKRLELKLKTFHYEYKGNSHFNRKSCVYINLNNTIRGKARSMMLTVSDLNLFVKQNNLELDGHPFLVVHNWNELADSINFDFCFPIKRDDAVPAHPLIKYKYVEGMNAVTSDFFGNYAISDISWYRLAEEAKMLGYKSSHKLIEVYHNDPHSGGNELEWKAEIYLGIEPKK